MKKIIVALDGLKYKNSSVLHAIDVAKKNGAHVVGVFLDDFTYHSYKVYDVVSAGESSDKIRHQLNERDEAARMNAVDAFKSACLEEGVSFSTHRNRNVALQELLHESVYSDLLIINPGETFTHFREPMPTDFITDLLSDVQCPVLLAPAAFKKFERVIFLYDGEPSSVYAIKMFDYLLDAYKGLPVTVISVSKDDDSTCLPDNYLIKELMKQHHPETHYVLLNGAPKEAITNYLADQPNNALVVLGAYQRGRVSRWLEPSMADHLMKELSLPLFIAHNR